MGQDILDGIITVQATLPLIHWFIIINKHLAAVTPTLALIAHIIQAIIASLTIQKASPLGWVVTGYEIAGFIDDHWDEMF